MAILIAGTSGYSFKEWKGAFYPGGLPDREMLHYYSRRLPGVEINYTFRHLPSAKTLAGWDAATPPGFRFILKASQRITHVKRLKDAGENVAIFCDSAAALGAKLGPILFQLPPFFKKDAERLAAFLEVLPAPCRYAFEFRHPTWFDREVLELLRRRGVSLCINETDDGAPALEVTAPYLYVRLRRESYAPAAVAAWGERLAALAAGGTDVYAFFKHEREGPRLARALLEAAGVTLAAGPAGEVASWLAPAAGGV